MATLAPDRRIAGRLADPRHRHAHHRLSSACATNSRHCRTRSSRSIVRPFPPTRTSSIRARRWNATLLNSSGGGSGGAGFLDLLSQAATGTQSHSPGLEMKSLRSQSGELELELNMADLQGLDQLKQRLTESGPLSVEIVSAASRDGKVEGRIKIKGKS